MKRMLTWHVELGVETSTAYHGASPIIKAYCGGYARRHTDERGRSSVSLSGVRVSNIGPKVLATWHCLETTVAIEYLMLMSLTVVVVSTPSMPTRLLIISAQMLGITTIAAATSGRLHGDVGRSLSMLRHVTLLIAIEAMNSSGVKLRSTSNHN